MRPMLPQLTIKIDVFCQAVYRVQSTFFDQVALGLDRVHEA